MISMKMQNSMVEKVIVFMALFALTGMASVSGADADLSIKANHDHIKVDFFYHGSEVSVRGESDPGTDLIVKIASPEGHQKLRKKGKAGGFLWMNVGELMYENAFNVYFLHSTRNVDDLLMPDEADRYIIGYRSMRDHIGITPVQDEEEKIKWFNEFVRFKENSGLYTIVAGDITLIKKDGRQNYFVHMDWPYKAPPGNYHVTVYAVKNKKIVDKAETAVLVEQVGIVKTLFDMANNRGAVYGILAILIALGAGFGVGMVFRKSGGAH